MPSGQCWKIGNQQVLNWSLTKLLAKFQFRRAGKSAILFHTQKTYHDRLPFVISIYLREYPFIWIEFVSPIRHFRRMLVWYGLDF